MPDDVSLPAARPSNRDLQTMRFDDALELYIPSLAEALPDHIPLQRFKRVLLTAVNLNPDLAHADRRSLFNSCVKCAHDGLYPDGREAALVVFETSVKTTNERGMDVWVKVPLVTYMPMIAGIRKRMRNSGEVVAAIAEVVYRHDKFRVVKGIDGRIEHEPPALDEDRGDAVGAYAQIKLRSGEVLQEVMTKREIEHIRDTFSRGAGHAKSPWKTSESEMWRKTVLRRCGKSAPSDSDLDRMLSRDDEPLELPPPHDVALPPPRPTRAQMMVTEGPPISISEVADIMAADAGSGGETGFSQNLQSDPAEHPETPERKEEPQRLEPQTTSDAPQERQKRHRRTKAEMEAARAAEKEPQRWGAAGQQQRIEQDMAASAAARHAAEAAEARSSTAEQSREDAGSTPAVAATYDVVDADGEIHEFGTPTEAVNFLGGLFAEARGRRQALEALRDDNQHVFDEISNDDPTAFNYLVEIYETELASPPPATTKRPTGTDDASELSRQALAASPPPPPASGEGIHPERAEVADPERKPSRPLRADDEAGGSSETNARQSGPAAGRRSEPRGGEDGQTRAQVVEADGSSAPRISYAIEPVYEKDGRIARAWWIALLLPKLRAAKSKEEFNLRLADNGETIAAYKTTLTPSGLVAAMKEIDDIGRSIA